MIAIAHFIAVTSYLAAAAVAALPLARRVQAPLLDARCGGVPCGLVVRPCAGGGKVGGGLRLLAATRYSRSRESRRIDRGLSRAHARSRSRHCLLVRVPRVGDSTNHLGDH